MQLDPIGCLTCSMCYIFMDLIVTTINLYEHFNVLRLVVYNNIKMVKYLNIIYNFVACTILCA